MINKTKDKKKRRKNKQDIQMESDENSMSDIALCFYNVSDPLSHFMFLSEHFSSWLYQVRSLA